jgi:hypothetical protein
VSDELDPNDKALLQDIQQFNRTYVAKGWHLRDKIVRQDLSRIVLSNSSMASVQFLHCDWKWATVSSSRLCK